MARVRQPQMTVREFQGLEATSILRHVSDPARWHGLPLRLLDNVPHREIAVPAMVEDVLNIQVEGQTQIEGSAPHADRRQLSYPGLVYVTPRGEPSRWAWTEGAAVIQIAIAPTQIADALSRTDIDASRIELVGRFAHSDALLHQLGVALLGELRSDRPGGRLYVESLSQAMIMHLIRHHSPDLPTLKQPRSLATQSLRLVMDYIGDNLEHDLSLRELATLAGVSQYHFARLFRRSVGVSPHAYVIEQRLQEAARLLRDERLTLAEVAASVGFADQSHLSRHYRRRFGVSPRGRGQPNPEQLPEDQ